MSWRRLLAAGAQRVYPAHGDPVKALPDGRVRVLFKTPWRSGVAHADMTADKFLARFCAFVPPPGFHMLRYYGVFASRHHRARIVPAAPATPELQLALDLTAAANDTRSPTDASPRPRRLGWAKLLARVFAVDVTVCRQCGRRMRVLEVVSTAPALHCRDRAPTLRAKSCCSPADRAPLASRPAAPWRSPEAEISPGKLGVCCHTNDLYGDLRTARTATKSASLARLRGCRESPVPDRRTKFWV
ncbi:MAG: transposase [Nannocystis sp.]|nr:transposase [Nannocystis sp.]